MKKFLTEKVQKMPDSELWAKWSKLGGN